MTQGQLKTINQLYVELWHLVRDYHNAGSDTQWHALADKADELVKQYGEDKRQLVLDTLELIERSTKHGTSNSSNRS